MADAKIVEKPPKSLKGTGYKGLTGLVATFGHGVTCS
jgi:hypothetical protein